VALAALGSVSFAYAAPADLLVGTFGHAYTRADGTPVWAIKKDKGQYLLVTLNDEGPPQQAHEFSEGERRQFWKALWWPEERSASASCVGNSHQVICHAPPQARSGISDLKNNTSSYFYRDPIAGLMEVRKLAP
jgi:hypothetical protein